MQANNGMLPAKIISYDRTTNRAIVLPLVPLITTDGGQVSRAQIANIPVMQFGGGGTVLTFNLVAGNLGWILANDRDISIFLQNYAESAPNTHRMNDFSDSLFIPDVMKGYTLNVEDSGHAVLQTLDGAVRLAVWPDRIKITAPLGLEVDGPISGNGGLNISGGVGSSFTVTGNMTLDGSLETVGNVYVDGNIEASGDITPHVPP